MAKFSYSTVILLFFHPSCPDQNAPFELIISRDWKMRQLVSGIEKRLWKLFHKIQRSTVGASKISFNPLNHTHTFLYFNGFFLMRLVFKLSGFHFGCAGLKLQTRPKSFFSFYRVTLVTNGINRKESLTRQMTIENISSLTKLSVL